MRPVRSGSLLLSAAAVLAACGGAAGPAGTVRYHNREPVWVVNDRRDVPHKPAELVFYKALYHFDGFWHARIDRWLQMRPDRRAANVNALDEVPDSTWFTNRIGTRDLTAEEVAAGPNTTGSPAEHRPWVIKSSKVGGITVGFIMKDQRGVKYVLKFDQIGIPEMETGADVVLQRILWACGYNVPEDYIVSFKRSDLVLADDAMVKDPMGNETPMTAEFLDKQLAKIEVGKDGTIRGLASQFLPGVPIGGHARDGRRPDDPNDTIRHELRRDLRGLYPIFAWLDQSDVKEDNSLDTYEEDPADPKVHYVVHYAIDFGKGLGTQPFINGRRFIGFEYLIDLGTMARRLLTLGLVRRPWENRLEPDIRGVGMLEARRYQPERWKPYTPSYFPFHDTDPFDGFWGAKIIARFTAAHIRAAVEQGHYSDPRAVEYLTRALLDRQRKTVRYWFSQVNPLDRFVVDDRGGAWRLCFDDLALRYRVADAGASGTRYAARVFDAAGGTIADGIQAAGGADGHACVEIPPAAGTDAYTIVELRTARAHQGGGPTLVHLARGPTGAPRVIGLRRE